MFLSGTSQTTGVKMAASVNTPEITLNEFGEIQFTTTDATTTDSVDTLDVVESTFPNEEEKGVKLSPRTNGLE